ncbi:hypothetical protein NLA06_08035 [Desulfomicrobium sp. ZS1]|uniref:hypothetical protein n=1 Tax=Desulfomicrobium sp. ZS1 TaxID=2952228 RepID=UPI0020B37E96|nr:hypothetical protein [Desulfomicrobium sp. ZS1]UTF51823.1 hypothetical protein NLA06_08035 [Desulfomicrobium sp. ZS1]
MNKKDKNLAPFGKYEGQPLEVLLADKPYCAWLVGQADLREQYPDLRDMIYKEHGNDIKTPNHNRMQAEYLTRDTMLKLFYLVNPEIFSHDKEYYVKCLDEYFVDKLPIVKSVCDRMNNRVFAITNMATEVSVISKNWALYGEKSYAVPVSPFKKYMDGREQEKYIFKNPVSLIVNDPEELYRNTILDFNLFYTFFDEFLSYLNASQFKHIKSCNRSFENKYNDVTIEIDFYEEIKPKFSARVEKFFERALYRHSSSNNETTNIPDFLHADWRYKNQKINSELYYIEIKPSIGDDYHAVLNQISNRREMNKMHFKQKASQNVRYLLVIGAYDGTGVSYENFKSIFKNEDIEVVLEAEIDNVKIPKIENDFRISFFEIPALNEIFNILDSVKKTIKSADECFVNRKNRASGF